MAVPSFKRLKMNAILVQFEENSSSLAIMNNSHTKDIVFSALPPRHPLNFSARLQGNTTAVWLLLAQYEWTAPWHCGIWLSTFCLCCNNTSATYSVDKREYPKDQNHCLGSDCRISFFSNEKVWRLSKMEVGRLRKQEPLGVWEKLLRYCKIIFKSFQSNFPHVTYKVK